MKTVANFEGSATSKLIIHSTQLPFHLFSDLLKFFKTLYFPADLHTIMKTSPPKHKAETSLAVRQPAIRQLWHFLSKQLRSVILTNGSNKMSVPTSFGVWQLWQQKTLNTSAPLSLKPLQIFTDHLLGSSLKKKSFEDSKCNGVSSQHSNYSANSHLH